MAEKLKRLDMFSIFNDGFIQYLGYFGSDAEIANDARVSYKGADAVYTEEDTTKDESLLRALLRQNHSSVFEHTLVKWCMRIPMDVWRKFRRHRTARYSHVNEYSTRYKDAIDSVLVANGWRKQSLDNKQGSSGFITDDAVVADLTIGEQKLHELSREVYLNRIEEGVAREQARKDIPLSTYTEVTVSCDVWNLMHFFMLRRKPDAQLEIRELANSLYENIFKPLFPATAQAFEDYRFNAISLSATEIKVIRGELKLGDIKSKREQDDCRLKMEQIGVGPYEWISE